jgi:hypothetical protein
MAKVLTNQKMGPVAKKAKFRSKNARWWKQDPRKSILAPVRCQNLSTSTVLQTTSLFHEISSYFETTGDLMAFMLTCKGMRKRGSSDDVSWGKVLNRLKPARMKECRLTTSCPTVYANLFHRQSIYRRLEWYFGLEILSDKVPEGASDRFPTWVTRDNLKDLRELYPTEFPRMGKYKRPANMRGVLKTLNVTSVVQPHTVKLKMTNHPYMLKAIHRLSPDAELKIYGNVIVSSINSADVQKMMNKIAMRSFKRFTPATFNGNSSFVERVLCLMGERDLILAISMVTALRLFITKVDSGLLEKHLRSELDRLFKGAFDLKVCHLERMLPPGAPLRIESFNMRWGPIITSEIDLCLFKLRETTNTDLARTLKLMVTEVNSN